MKILILVLLVITAGTHSVACGETCNDYVGFEPGETWEVLTTWDRDAIPILNEPIEQISGYNNTRLFRAEDNLAGYAEPTDDEHVTIYIIKKHQDYDDWLHVEAEEPGLFGRKINGWVYKCWITWAAEVREKE